MCSGFLRPEKIHRPQPDMNPRTLDLEASTLPRDHLVRQVMELVSYVDNVILKVTANIHKRLECVYRRMNYWKSHKALGAPPRFYVAESTGAQRETRVLRGLHAFPRGCVTTTLNCAQ